jgi:hypothetical protein
VLRQPKNKVTAIKLVHFQGLITVFWSCMFQKILISKKMGSVEHFATLQGEQLEYFLKIVGKSPEKALYLRFNCNYI